MRDDATAKSTRLNIFVYGTLKRGQRNHGRFCRDLISAQEATVRGRLYDLPYGFPALVVPKVDILARGTTDYLTDTESGHRKEAEPPQKSLGWDIVCGELLSFDDPEKHLPAFDELEGFYPGGKSLYERILIPVTLLETDATLPAWAYVVESASGTYLPGGYWPAP